MKFSDKNNFNVLIEECVLEIFEEHKQLNDASLEAGGQLFAHFSDNTISISRATGIRDGDKRSRFFFIPNRLKERIEIKKHFKQNLHYVGDWHTHPQSKPIPSNTDIENITECFRLSKHDLKYFIMIVVGIDKFPNGLSVSLHNSQNSKYLEHFKNY